MTVHVVVALAMLAASFSLGLTGYGFGLIAMGVLPYVVSVAEANALVAPLALVVTVVSLVPRIRLLRPRLLLPLLLGALAGVPVGVFVLVRLDETLLRGLLGGAILVALAASLVTSWRERAGAGRDRSSVRESSAAAPGTARDGERPGADSGATGRDRAAGGAAVGVAVGLVSGAFGGAFSVSGPPVVIYFNEVFRDKAVIKAHLVAYFTFVIFIRIPFLVAGGLYDGRLVVTALAALPVVLGGLWLGSRLHDRLPSAVVRRVIQVLLALSAALLIVGA